MNIARYLAATLAALWAMAGLSNDYLGLSTVGPSAGIIAGIIVNIALAVAASLTFVQAAGWYRILLAVLAVATTARIIIALGSPSAWPQIIAALIALGAIAAAATMAAAARTR